MRILLLLTLLGLAVWSVGGTLAELYKRVRKGKACESTEAKYQVFVSIGAQWCGGSLISPKWVLTSKHCNNLNLKVYIGIRNRGTLDPSKAYTGVPHPYPSSKMDPDLMLIKLNKDAPAGSSTVHLPTDCINKMPPSDIQTTALLLAGWGKDENGNYPLQLQCVRLQGTTSLDQEEFCAGKADEGIGEADSGGGLVHTGRNMVYGVVVSHCWLDPNGPSLRSQFVNVCHFLQWIQNEMNAHP